MRMEEIKIFRVIRYVVWNCHEHIRRKQSDPEPTRCAGCGNYLKTGNKALAAVCDGEFYIFCSEKCFNDHVEKLGAEWC